MKKQITILLIVAWMLIGAGGCEKTHPQKQARQETKIEKFQRLEEESIAAAEAEAKRLQKYNEELQRQDRKKQERLYGNKLDAFDIAKDFVTRRLKCPRTAKWPWFRKESDTSHLGNGRYQISSYLDAQNGFGALVRVHFICVVQYTGGSNWRLISLTM